MHTAADVSSGDGTYLGLDRDLTGTQIPDRRNLRIIFVSTGVVIYQFTYRMDSKYRQLFCQLSAHALQIRNRAT
jgi:hypothetical protein